jgi:hypothetical protein
MSTSQKRIYLGHEFGTDLYLIDIDDKYLHRQEQPQISVTENKCIGTYNATNTSNKFVVIESEIYSQNTLIIIEYPLESKPCHVHIIEHLCPEWEYNEFDEVSDLTIFVIFHDHILRILLTNTSNGFTFKECKTDFSFSISMIEESSFEELSFTLLEDETRVHLRECLVVHLRACLLSDETSWKKVELVEIKLFSDDERLFTIKNPVYFKLPRYIDFYCVDFDRTNSDIVNMCLIEKTNNTLFSVFIHYGKTVFDYDAIPIFLLQNYEGKCILVINDQLRRFQQIGFEIIATIYVCPFGEIGELKPEITDCIDNMLKFLNKYHRSREDSDYGSDYCSDSD